jgi:hypothetical protein
MVQWDPRVPTIGTLCVTVGAKGSHCCAAIACDHISARMTQDATVTLDLSSAAVTYVMWHEDHLWHVSVLQRIQLNNFVSFCDRSGRTVHLHSFGQFLSILISDEVTCLQ